MSAWWFPLVLVVITLIRLGLGRLDRGNIEVAAAAKGWRNVRVRWAPFSLRAIFEKGERSYRVDYDDRDGVTHTAFCKTSLTTGVYWRD